MSNLRRVISETLDEVLARYTDGGVLGEIGEALVRSIRARVRLGFGCAGDGAARSKFLPLKASTIRNRERMLKNGTLSPLTRPRMSNQTMTGHMLDGLRYRVVGTGLVIDFENTFASDKAVWNHRLGRPFMYLTNSEIKQITQILKGTV
jgi:hypothetical protein